MHINRPRTMRFVALCAAASILAACGLPRSGPTKNEIFKGSVERQGNAFVVTVDDRVAEVTRTHPGSHFDQALISAGQIGSDTIRPGDTLGLTIYENVDDGLLAVAGTNAAQLEEIQVDGAGFIYVPYAGRIRAAGNTPEAVRRIITEKLESQTPDPQVLVRRLAGDGATVSLIGGVGAQGVYPIERPNRKLTSMLATAGGIVIPSDIAKVTLIRNGHTGTIWLEDLYSNPALDIALRDGDRILVEEDERFFTTLGATGKQTKVPFDTQTVSAIEALAIVGGLSSQLADPTGIFVFRDESEVIAESVLGQDVTGPVRVVYLLDLTKPNGVFLARDFQIRTEDTVYVTEAPYTQFNKALGALTAPLGTVATIDRLSE